MRELKTVIWLTLASLGFRVLLFFLFSNEIIAGSDFIRMAGLGRKFASGNFYGVLDTYWSPAYPVLLGILTIFTNSVMNSAIIISIIAATLIVPLTYYLVKQSYGEKIGIIAAVIAIWFPHLINSFFAVGTENLYLLWITGSLILGWRGLNNNSVKDYFFTGILIGLAYLTRPEAIGYVIFFISIIFIRNLLQKKNPFDRNASKQVFIFLIGFALLASPYFIYLKQKTGTWTISGKVQKNLIVSADENEIKIDNPDVPKPEEGMRTYLKYFGLNLIESQKTLTYLVPTFLFILVGLGLFVTPWNEERIKRETFLIAFLILTIAGYAASVVRDRYFYIILPVFLGWIAYGIVQLEKWFHETIQNFSSYKILGLFNRKSIFIICLFIIYIYVLPLNFFFRTKDKAWDEKQYEERDAGLWLKENGNPSSLVYSTALRTNFYSEMRHFPDEAKTVEEALNQIKEKQIDYVVIGERYFKYSQTLKGLGEALENSPDFEKVYERKDHKSYGISIFKVK